MGRRFRFLSFILSAIVVFAMIPATRVSAETRLSDRDFWNGISGHYYYDRLTDKEKVFYNELGRVSSELMFGDESNPNISINVADMGLSQKQLVDVFYFFKDDNPQYYFILNGFSYYMNTYTGQIVEIHDYVYSDFLNGNTRSSTTKQLRTNIEAWNKEINSGLTSNRPAEVELYIHDYIIQKLTYDLSSVYDGQNIVSAFNTQRTVCTGYSKAFQILLKLHDIEAICVESEAHMWNFVNVHGYWYCVDVTNDDRNPISHTRFNVSFAYLLYNSDIYSPVAGAFYEKMPDNTEYNGYYVEELYFEYDGNTYFFVDFLNGLYCKKVSEGGSNPHYVYYNNTRFEVTNSPIPLPSDTGNSIDQIRAFVDRMYTCVLGRDAEPEGEEFWVNELYNYRNTGAECAYNFLKSAEFRSKTISYSDYLNVLYRAFFNREFDYEGKNFWTIALCKGEVSLDTLADFFINSKEWADTCASYGIKSGGTAVSSVKIAPTDATNAFVERLYQTALGREYDTEGRDFWAKLLANFELTGEDAGVEFFLSPEMEGLHLSDEEFVERLYLTFMDRSSDSSGKAFWVDQLKTGATRKEVVLGFTRSTEFGSKCIEARIIPFK